MFLSVAFVSLLMFSSSVVASIVIVHANLRREHDAVVLYRRHLMYPSYTYATPPLTEISNYVWSTLSVSKPVHVFSKLTFGRIDSSLIMTPHSTVIHEHVCTGRTDRHRNCATHSFRRRCTWLVCFPSYMYMYMYPSGHVMYVSANRAAASLHVSTPQFQDRRWRVRLPGGIGPVGSDRGNEGPYMYSGSTGNVDYITASA